MTAADNSFRPDIQGLRGLAVGLILLYHAGLPGLAGGYVGVDVFYVISGYLITRLLRAEIDRTGSVDYVRFYARRARRILPAAFLVLAATWIAAMLLQSPLRFLETATEIAAAAAYVPNILFAAQATDYLRPLGDPPVLHFWSLGVEEQFYLFWPALLGLSAKVIGRDHDRLVRPIWVIVVGSFLLSALVTEFRPTDAFYLLPMRAWELGVGGLLGTAELRPGSRLGRSGLTVAGLSMIGAAAVFFGSTTPFPGVAAALPVVGAATLVVAGSRPTDGPIAKLLTNGPVTFLGQVSYSLYLWHWPVLVFLAIAIPNPPALVVASAVIASVGLSALTYRFVERPLRDGVAIGTRPRWNIALALLGSVVIGAGCLLTAKVMIRPFEGPQLALDPARLAATPRSELGPVLSGSLPLDLVPALATVDETVPKPTVDRCNVTGDGARSGNCTYGDATATTIVVLFGDSHALNWFPAVEQLAIERGWRLVSLTKDACPYADIPRLTYGGRPDAACASWRSDSIARIADLRPRLVITSSNHTIVPSMGNRNATGPEAVTLWEAGIDTTIRSLTPIAQAVVVLGDTPEAPWNVPDCLASHPNHIEVCAFDRTVAVDSPWVATERADATAAGARFVDVTSWVCPTDPCAVIRGRFLVLTDNNHLAWPFVTALTPDFSAAVVGP